MIELCEYNIQSCHISIFAPISTTDAFFCAIPPTTEKKLVRVFLHSFHDVIGLLLRKRSSYPICTSIRFFSQQIKGKSIHEMNTHDIRKLFKTSNCKKKGKVSNVNNFQTCSFDVPNWCIEGDRGTKNPMQRSATYFCEFSNFKLNFYVMKNVNTEKGYKRCLWGAIRDTIFVCENTFDTAKHVNTPRKNWMTTMKKARFQWIYQHPDKRNVMANIVKRLPCVNLWIILFYNAFIHWHNGKKSFLMIFMYTKYINEQCHSIKTRVISTFFPHAFLPMWLHKNKFKVEKIMIFLHYKKIYVKKMRAYRFSICFINTS